MTAKKHPKIFVLDTNVILHDSSCIHQFEEHDIVLPIVVLEELDQFKKGNDSINFHARHFVRTVDNLSGDKLFNGGIGIGPGLGKLGVRLDREFHPDLAFNFGTSKVDHHILNTAYWIAKEKPANHVILVTKDVNLRMKAKALGLMAQDYTTDHVKDVSSLYIGRRLVDDVPDHVIQAMYAEPHECPITDTFKLDPPPHPNEYFILRNASASALARYHADTNSLRRVNKLLTYGITPRNAEQTFALDALLDPSISLVSLSGKAGTGKTLLALAAALQKQEHYRQICVARPIVPLSNKDVGFLPGDIQSKLGPYMQPLYDNLGVIQNQFHETDGKHRKIRESLDHDKLVISPLSYIRGRSLVNIYFIVDEAQNLTPHEIKTIITRAGEGTKMIFTGDIYQIDHPYLDSNSNGLSYLIARMQGQTPYAHVNLERGERSELAEMASNLL